MRAVVQRVSRAEVRVEGETVGRIGAGLCVLVGVARGDDDAAAAALASKVVGLRIFEGDDGKMTHDVLARGGAVLAVSQFTLLADTTRGRRPSFSQAMEPALAERLFARFCDACRALGAAVETGRFRTHMCVSLDNDGPVTLIVDTARSSATE